MARSIITTAYGLRWEQVVGGPGWLDTEHWDIEARAAETATVEDVRAMLRSCSPNGSAWSLAVRHANRTSTG